MIFNVYYISDKTAITAEAFGKTLISQFSSVTIKQSTHRFIDSDEKAHKLKIEINTKLTESNNTAILFSTLVDPKLREIVKQSSGHFLDLFNLAIPELEKIFKCNASINSGLAHGSVQDRNYEQRMDAVNFALVHDDGISVNHYDKADIILTGVSRSGKTPTSLYLAMHYGIYTANYPLTEETLTTDTIPTELQRYQSRVFALTIQADRLQKIRASRLPDTQYSSLNQCKLEIRQAEKLIKKSNFPVLDVTSSSVEEIATTVLHFYNSNKI
jgi:regulator of PEP synthase PpsR (kinase-PPPase family)